MENQVIESGSESASGLEAKLPIVVEIIPSAAESGLPKLYKENLDKLEKSTIGDVLKEILAEEPENRELKSLMQVAREEYSAKSVFSVRGKKIDPASAKVSDYLQENTTPTGHRYRHLPVSVLKPQEGGQYD